MKILLLFISGLVFVLTDDSIPTQNFINGNRRFAANIYQEIAKNDNNNFIVSPLSVQLILALARLGAKGKTAQELSNVLDLPNDDGEIVKIFEGITPYLKKSDPYILASANKIYVKNGLVLNEDYQNTATKSFKAEVENVNFLNPDTASKINSWVSENTFKKIQDVVSPKSFTPLTQSLFINTLYFKGFWENAFNKHFTQPKPFFISNSEEKQTDTMEITSKFKYANNENLNTKFLELPYKGGDISMVIVLPNDGLSSLESRLVEVFEEQSYDTLKVHLQMPKFTTKSTIQFTDILRNLGIQEAFLDKADFTGMGKTQNSLFKISNILQKALIEVDEEGTTAAAATAIHVLRPGPPEFIFEFIANRPFIYFLKSKSVGILFVGRYMSP